MLAEEPIDVRIENLTVLPSTGPLAHIAIRNLSQSAIEGVVDATFPPGWKMNASSRPFSLKPGETHRAAFAVEKGADNPANAYPVSATVKFGEAKIAVKRVISVATTPYFKPMIDGNLEDWKDAVPVSFETAGKKTTISTYWSRRAFSLLVVVDEDRFLPIDSVMPFDAVQVAVAPREAKTPSNEDAEDQRFEFLIAGQKDGPGACFTLYRPGMQLAETRQPRALAGRETPGALVAVRREGRQTYYECSIPMNAMPSIQAEPGREFCLSILVHDPDGTGLRDWGQAAGLACDRRNRLAWSDWVGAKWPPAAPFDNKIEWGFCSSKN